MYLDYESFVDCLIKSGYEKTNSCLTHETWTNGKDIVEIRVDDCVVYEINGCYLEDWCGITYQSVGKTILLNNYT